jgi:hypothetical protein
MGRFKKPIPKTVKCEDCGRLFGNGRDLAQHLNSKAHASVISHDEGTLPFLHSPPVTSDTPSTQPPVLKPLSFDVKPEGDEFPKKDSLTPKPYILTPIPGKGQGLIAVQDISKGTRILSEKPLFRIQSFGSELPVIEKDIERKLNLLSENDRGAFHSLHNSTPGDS